MILPPLLTICLSVCMLCCLSWCVKAWKNLLWMAVMYSPKRDHPPDMVLNQSERVVVLTRRWNMSTVLKCFCHRHLWGVPVPCDVWHLRYASMWLFHGVGRRACLVRCFSEERSFGVNECRLKNGLCVLYPRQNDPKCLVGTKQKNEQLLIQGASTNTSNFKPDWKTNSLSGWQSCGAFNLPFSKKKKKKATQQGVSDTPSTGNICFERGVNGWFFTTPLITSVTINSHLQDSKAIIFHWKNFRGVFVDLMKPLRWIETKSLDRLWPAWLKPFTQQLLHLGSYPRANIKLQHPPSRSGLLELHQAPG